MKGSPGGILAIALGTFLIAIAYTGRLQEVWQAATGGRGPIRDPDTGLTEETGPASVTGCPEDGMTRLCRADNMTEEVCFKPGDDLEWARANGYVSCKPLGTAAGEAFAHIIPNGIGGWRRSLNPSTKWSPSHVY